ncbi:MAG: FtsW/RodA/SpoVE family cell cycle protein, partial [Eubacterium sp.]|nr:FtsW/RodA/SpoVE family cell cycle protein [Eubacterium sp.]
FASYICDYYSKMKNFKYGVLYPLGIIVVFCGLIFLEHHMSCTILMFLIGATMMWVGGSDWKLFAFGLAVLVLVVFIVITMPDMLENYAGDRVKAWLDKDFDPRGARWQTNNSLYAIGSGGLFGVGLGNSKQKYLYVSEPQNDFIFSIVCEELGFVGAALIIILFTALVIRGFVIASRCHDRFGALLIIGIVAQIGVQVGLNILVVTDTLPNTGIALPFFSYGGTSILLLLFQIGVVLSVSRKASQKKV